MLSKLRSSELPTITTLVYVLPVIFTLYIVLSRSLRIYNNYRRVRHLSPTIPIIIAPWTWQDPIWLLLGRHLVPFLNNVPGFRAWIWCSYMGWTNVDKGRAHLPVAQNGRGLGPAFILVSPSRTEFFITDPSATVEVARDWKTWTKPSNLYAVFDIFGKNVNSVNGENGDWQRHRKITGGAFSRDATLGLVWDEARKRTQPLIRRLLEGDRKGSNNDTPKGELTMAQVRDEMSMLTMHVLSVAGFGKHEKAAHLSVAEEDTETNTSSSPPSARPTPAKRTSTTDSVTGVSVGHKLSYFECTQRMWPNLLGVVMFGTTKLPSWILPKSINDIKLAVEEYRLYLHEALSRYQDRRGADQEEHGEGTGQGTDLASMLIKANEAEKVLDNGTGIDRKGGLKSYLTESELYGNMFMFNVAGFETTSMALSFAIPYLALNPGLWDWVKEEVDVVVGELGSTKDYEKVFDRLVRCRALMYESLRLHNAVAHLPRQSPAVPASLDIPHPHSSASSASSASSSSSIPSRTNVSTKATKDGKGSNNHDSSSSSKTLTLTIPPNSLISIPIVIMGYLPELFPDPYVFDPRRYLTSTSASDELGQHQQHQHQQHQHQNQHHQNLAPHPAAFPGSIACAGHETLVSEKQLALQGFQPWISGPRVCPGRKFSQVEFVAVIAEMAVSGVRVGLRSGGGGVGDADADADSDGNTIERERQRQRQRQLERERQALDQATRDVVFNLGTRIRREGEVGVRFYRDI